MGRSFGSGQPKADFAEACAAISNAGISVATDRVVLSGRGASKPPVSKGD